MFKLGDLETYVQYIQYAVLYVYSQTPEVSMLNFVLGPQTQFRSLKEALSIAIPQL